MNKHFSSFYNKVKAMVLLLCLFFMMTGACPVRTILSSASFSIVESSKQSVDTEAFVNKSISCSFKGKISQATLLDLSKTNNNSLPLPFILAIFNLYLFASVLNTWKRSTEEHHRSPFIYNIPLFLKIRSIII